MVNVPDMRRGASGFSAVAWKAQGFQREGAKTQRGGAATKDFLQERTEETERTSFAKNALFLDIALQDR